MYEMSDDDSSQDALAGTERPALTVKHQVLDSSVVPVSGCRVKSRGQSNEVRHATLAAATLSLFEVPYHI